MTRRHTVRYVTMTSLSGILGFVIGAVVFVTLVMYRKRIMYETGITWLLMMARRLWTSEKYCEDPGPSPAGTAPALVIPGYIQSLLTPATHYAYLYPQDAEAKIDSLCKKYMAEIQGIVDKVDGKNTAAIADAVKQWEEKGKMYNECLNVNARTISALASKSAVSTITTLLLSTVKSLGPYIALIAIIALFIVGCIGMAFPAKKLGWGSSNKTSTWMTPPDAINPMKILERYTRMFAPRDEGKDRPVVMQGGRCGDGWIDNSDTNYNECLNTVAPDPIPIKDNNGNEAYIPWLAQTTFFVPQCGSATVDEEGKTKLATEKQVYTMTTTNTDLVPVCTKN